MRPVLASAPHTGSAGLSHKEESVAKQWDVIVIGAGLGGLSAAAHLARAGKSVLVLEQGSGPGGYAYGMQRGDYYFDFSLHSMDGIAPGGWAYVALHELGVLDRVTFKRLDPCYVTRFPDREITAHANPIDYEAELIRHFPAESAGIRALFSEMLAIYHETHRLRTDTELAPTASADDMPCRFPHLIRSVSESWAQLLERHIHTPELKAMISPLWLYCGLPPSRLSATAFALLWGSAHHYGGYYPQGGSMAINQALVERIQAGQGEIHYQQQVTRIHIQDGHATGVSTASGLHAQARAVISNASAPGTLLNLIEPEHLPPGYITRVAVTPDSLSTFNIFLGLDRNKLQKELPHELFILDSYNPEEHYAATLSGDWERVPLILGHYTHANPDCAPADGAVITVMCLAPWSYQDVWGTGGDLNNYQQNTTYQQLKTRVAHTLLARVERHVPGLGAAIRQQEIATPLTNAQFTLNRSGAIFGYEQSVAGMYMGRLTEQTPIPNLFLAGAWTVPGGGQSAVLISGYDSARHCVRYLDVPPDAIRPTTTHHTGIEVPPGAPAPATNGTAPIPLLQQPAPDFTLTAIASGREVSVARFAQRPLVLIFASQNTTALVGEINGAVRAQLPLPTQATIASVFDFGNVPPLFHGMIKFMLKRAYKQAAQGVPPGFDPADYILILPDWTGQVRKQFGIDGVDKAAAVVVIDRAGKVQGVLQGTNVVESTMDLLKWM